MTSGDLHDTFALLLREQHTSRAALSAASVRSIRRRLALRWTAGLGAFVTVVSLGAVAFPAITDGRTPDGGTGDADMTQAALMSPIPTPTLRFATVTFPLTGGAEFVPASAGLKCGDPAPAAYPIGHDLSLTVSEGTVFALGEARDDGRPLTVRAAVRQVTQGGQGTIATSGIDFLVVDNGIIKGMLQGNGVGLAQNVVGGTVSTPQTHLLADGAVCPDGEQGTPAHLAAGTYQVVAVGRVFSTPESVALSQTLGDTINVMYLNANSHADPAALYLPGMYTCKTARAWDAALRGCLPDITANAVIDEPAGTVTVVYRTNELVDEFSIVLVSEPLTVELLSSQGPADATSEAGTVAL